MSRSLSKLARTRTRALLLVLAGTVSTGCERAIEPFDVPESFVEHRLGNGIRLLVGERRGSGLVASSVLVRAGALRESEDLAGAAHFLEHLLFNGTTTRTQEELYAEVDRLGAYNNAATRRDYAIFMFLVGSESLEEGLGIHADMLFRSTLPPDKFEKEKGIVLEEIAKERSNQRHERSRALDEALYAGSAYARPILGTRTSIAALEREAVLHYYHAHYTPSNTTVLLIGDMDVAEMVGVAERTYGAVADPSDRASLEAERAPSLDGSRRVHVPLEGIERIMRLRVEAPPPGDADESVFELLPSILAGGRGARLQRAMEIAPPLRVNAIRAGMERVGGRSFFDVDAEMSPGTDPDLVAARVAGELQRLSGERIEEGEIAAARVTFRGEEASLREKIHYYGMMRSDVILHSDVAHLNEQLERHRRVSPGDVRDAAERWLNAPNVIVVAVGPELSELDERTTSPAIGFATPPVDLPGSGPVAVLDARRAPPRAEAASAPRLVTTDRGLRVVVSTDPSSNVLAVHVTALGRSFREPEGLEGIADFMHRLLVRGAGDWDGAALAARLSAIGANVKTHDDAAIPYDDYYTDPSYSYVRFETLDDHHDEAFELLGAMITRPRFVEGEIARVRDEMMQVASGTLVSPIESASLVYRRALYGEGAPGARPISGRVESLGRIDREALEAFHRRYFAPENLVIAVVTGLPEALVLKKIDEHFRFPPPNGTLDPWSFGAVSPAATGAPVVVEEVVGKPQCGVSLGYAFDFDPEDEAAIRVTNLLLAERMAFHLRERLALAYGLGSGFSTWGNRGVLTAWMGTRPENVEIAVAGLGAQIDSLAMISPEPLALETVVNAALGRMRMRRITRMGQAFHLSMDVLRGEPLLSHDEKLVAMRAVTPLEVREAAAKYFDSTRAHRIVVR